MTDRPLYYLLDGQGNPYPTNDSSAANELAKDIEKCRVARTEKEIARRKVLVSTIFLCIDERYIRTASEDVEVTLFQTCVFVDRITGGFVSTGFEKYHKTRQEALRGHEDICRDVDFLCDEIVKGHIQWSDLGKKLEQQQGLREITQISQEMGEYD